MLVVVVFAARAVEFADVVDDASVANAHVNVDADDACFDVAASA